MKTGMLAQVRLSCKELSKGKQFTGWQYMMNEDLDWARSTIKFDLTYTAYDSLPKTLEVYMNILTLPRYRRSWDAGEGFKVGLLLCEG